MDSRKRCWCGDLHSRSFTKAGRKHFSWLHCLAVNRRNGY